jgi:FkbH-like protein
MLNQFLSELFTGKLSKAISILENISIESPAPAEILTMLRLIIFKPEPSFLSYQRIFNIWSKWGQPPLKQNSTKLKIVLLSDFTANHFSPMIKLFSAAQGVEAEVILPGFDSIEQTALDPSSKMYECQPDFIALIFSEYWLQKYIGKTSLVNKSDLEEAQDALSNLISAIKSNSSASILVGNQPHKTFALPAGNVSLEKVIGSNIAINKFNHWLGNIAERRLIIIDIAESIFDSGGRKAMGNTNYFRARMAFEMSGTLSVAKEIASAVCHLSGKTHRALVTDFDNTIWGGEIAELGNYGIECGHESPEALGFLMTQEYIKSLRPLGVLLAGVSRNDPKIKTVFTENEDLALKLDDFASLQLGWLPKSDYVSQVSNELGFGSDFMVYMDDSLFEIAQVLSAHPYMDVIMAGPDSQSTITQLTSYRFFNAVSLSSEDLERGSQALKLKEQRTFKKSFSKIEDFLEAIEIRLSFCKLNSENLNRVVQLFQKTNQFNLTTRRHKETDLKHMEQKGAEIYSVRYEDNFGSQGIISVFTIMPEIDALRIESWLMSCRVLNRTVEQAVFAFIVKKANSKQVIGEYIPTEKNRLVQPLLRNLGFQQSAVTPDESNKEQWIYSNSNFDFKKPLPKHYALIKEI